MAVAVNVAALGRDYLSGKSLRRLALEYGIDHKTVSNLLKGAGIQPRHCGRQKATDEAAVAEQPIIVPPPSPYVDTTMLASMPLKPAIQGRVLGGRVWR